MNSSLNIETEACQVSLTFRVDRRKNSDIMLAMVLDQGKKQALRVACICTSSES